MRQVPSYLSDLIIGKGLNTEVEYNGIAICPSCSNPTFRLYITEGEKEYEGRKIPMVTLYNDAFFFRIELECSNCNTNYLILDKDFHGWNGLICHDEEQAKLDRPPLKKCNCDKCNNDAFEIEVKIQGDTRDEFIEETDREVDESKWFDAFGWFALSTKCSKCKLEVQEYATLETM